MEIIICASQTIICEPKMIATVRSMIVCGAGIVVCRTKMTGDAAQILVSVAQKIESLIDLIAGRMEILVSQWSTINDDVEIIVKETELIVSSKRKTGGKRGTRKRCVWCEATACLVCLVVFPFMPPHRASRVPFLPR